MTVKTKTRNSPNSNGGLTFKVRGKDDKKKIMIYGNDGTGKSTFAEQYCKEHGLNPVVIDVDDTNYTNLPIVEVDLSTDLNAYRMVKDVILKIKQCDDFDTIIFDGVTSYLEMLVSKANGLKKYSDRSERWNDILKHLQTSGKHLIFIGQADMKVIFNDEHQSSKAVIKVNSIVNEKYHCFINEKGKYDVETVKYRTIKE